MQEQRPPLKFPWPDQATRAVLATQLLPLAIALFLTPLAQAAKSQVTIFWDLIFYTDLPAAWIAFGAGLAVFAGAMVASRFRGARTPFSVPDFVERALWLLLGLYLVGCVIVSGFVMHCFPLSMDEQSAYFGAQTLASGHIANRVQPELIDWLVPARFQGHFFHVSHARGEYVSSYWPGFALILAVFTVLGVPWLCNPVLTTLTVGLIYLLTRQLTQSKTAAAWALGFAMCAATVLVNAGSYYSMPAHLLANTLFAYLLVQERRRMALLAGVCGSYALILHNPLPHALFAFPWICWLALYKRRLLWPLLLGYLVFAPAIGLGWSQYLNSFDASHYVIAEKAQRGAQSDGPFLDVLARLHDTLKPPTLVVWISRLAGLGKLVLWAVPGCIVLAWMGWRNAAKLPKEGHIPALRLMGISIGLTFVVFLFVKFDQGHGWGFRYLQPVWLGFPILAGWYLARLPEGQRVLGVPVSGFFGLCILITGVFLTPYRALESGNFIARQMNQIPTGPTAPAAVVFIQEEGGYYRRDLIYNPPFLANPEWRVCWRGAGVNAAFARRWLVGARRVSQGEWGERWVGTGWARKPTP